MKSLSMKSRYSSHPQNDISRKIEKSDELNKYNEKEVYDHLFGNETKITKGE